MKIHLVSGFLGSGKTTAIASAAKRLIASGKRVGVITNDQGKLLIDTQFLTIENVPTVEVNGGCFCCNYSEFDSKLDYFTKTLKPDVIFAESVGSCADVVATVMKPLVDYKMVNKKDTSLSVFTDIRLLEKYLLNEDLPFQEGVIYIFEKQIEETDLLILNKADLFSADRLNRLLDISKKRYPQKQLVPQSSFVENDITRWLEIINSQNTFPTHNLDIDYQIYGNAEQTLTWYDASLKVYFRENEFGDWMDTFVNQLLEKITGLEISIGHLKFFLEDCENYQKISVVSESNYSNTLSWVRGKWISPVNLTINARLACGITDIKAVIRPFITSNETVQIELLEEKSFQPGFPKPTHRID